MIYVISDIHGNMPRFRSVMAQINLQPEDTLYILGDVIDRHPHGITIIQELMAMPNVKMILGNHEFMLLDTLGYPYDGFSSGLSVEEKLDLWCLNGGEDTLEAFSKLSHHEQDEVVHYLLSLPLNLDIEVCGKRYTLVHGSPVESYTEGGHYRSAAHCAVWRRVRRCDAPKDGTLIFGHTATKHYQYFDPMSIWYGPKMIGLDCGSGYHSKHVPKGRLACLRLDDMKEFYG